jgi:thiol-disulfide isomerase/thioredoxin
MKSFLWVLLCLFSIPVLAEGQVPNFPLTRKDNGSVFPTHRELNALDPEQIFVFNFTKTTCKPCKKEIPELILLAKTNPKMKLALVFMGDPDREVEATVAALGVPPDVLVLLDRLEISFNRLAFTGVPHTFVTGKDKLIKARLEGYTDENMGILKSILKK